MDSQQPQNAQGGYWTDFPITYRAELISAITKWIVAGESGTVVGRSGTGKSNLASFMVSRPEAFSPNLPGALIDCCFPQLDINSLPAVTTSNFYRGMLYALQTTAGQIDQALAQALAQLIPDSTKSEDTLALYFNVKQAHELLIRRAQKNIIWIIDRFDEACQRLESGTLNSLRHLRDNHQFRGKLSYVVFTRHPLAQLRNPTEYDEFHEIMVANICWVGPMVLRDAHWVVRQMAERYRTTLDEAIATILIELSGSWPAFLKAACTAYAQGLLSLRETAQEWTERLLAQPVFLRNCQELWSDCSDAERAVLMAVVRGDNSNRADLSAVTSLETTGLLTAPTTNHPRRIFSPIFATFIERQKNAQTPGIRVDPQTELVLRDGLPLQGELTPQEYCLLRYFIRHVGEVCEKDELITNIWSEEVSDENLTQLVKRLREKIEERTVGHTYIHTVRGRGYRFVQPER